MHFILHVSARTAWRKMGLHFEFWWYVLSIFTWNSMILNEFQISSQILQLPIPAKNHFIYLFQTHASLSQFYKQIFILASQKNLETVRISYKNKSIHFDTFLPSSCRVCRHKKHKCIHFSEFLTLSNCFRFYSDIFYIF